MTLRTHFSSACSLISPTMMRKFLLRKRTRTPRTGSNSVVDFSRWRVPAPKYPNDLDDHHSRALNNAQQRSAPDQSSIRHEKRVRRQVVTKPDALSTLENRETARKVQEHRSHLRTERCGDSKSLQRETGQIYCTHSLHFRNGKDQHLGTLNLDRRRSDTQFNLSESVNRKFIPAECRRPAGSE